MIDSSPVVTTGFLTDWGLYKLHSAWGKVASGPLPFFVYLDLSNPVFGVIIVNGQAPKSEVVSLLFSQYFLRFLSSSLNLIATWTPPLF